MPRTVVESETPTVPVRCVGCRRTVGYANSNMALRSSIYCSQWCANEPDVTPAEARNDMWKILTTKSGKSPYEVSKMYGVAHSLVYKTLAKYNSK